MPFVPAILMAVALTGAGAPAHATVVDAQPNGFQVHVVIQVKAPAAKAYADLTQIGRWWSGEHSYSGDTHNFVVDPHVGGCWCEKLPSGGEVQHMRIDYVDPGKAFRMDGGLGPLEDMGVTGHMGFVLTEKAGVTTIDMTYEVGGYTKGGLNALAGPVDGVLTEEMGRLKSLIETGKPS